MEERKDEKKEITEEDLIDFELEDLELESDGGPGDSEDDEILELVDLVEKGEKQREESQEEEEILLREQVTGDAEEEIEFATDELADLAAEEAEEGKKDATSADMSLSDLSISDLTLEEESSGEMIGQVDDSELDLEKLLDEESTEAIDLGVTEEAEDEEKKGVREEEGVTEKDIEAMLEEAPTQLIDFKLDEGERQEESELEREGAEELLGEEEATSELERREEPQEVGVEETREEKLKLSEAISMEGVPGLEGAGEGPSSGEAVHPFISEEKIEEIVRRVVGEVLERVTRETMAEVAERVIKEAIETLKESIESPRG